MKSSVIPVTLAVEDALSEAVLRALLRQSRNSYEVGPCYRRQGFGYLKKMIGGFNNAAKGTPFCVLTDLDKTECPPTLISEWLSQPRHPNLLLRVAVRAVESWILAHHKAFSKLLGISPEMIPIDVDGIADPKRFLIDLARKSPNSGLRSDLAGPRGSLRKQGPDYNGRLILFVREQWRPDVGRSRSPSLSRTMDALDEFNLSWA